MPTPSSGQDVSRLLQMLASEFRYVVVDTAPGLSDHTLAALDQTTDLVLVTSMDVPGVRGLRKELDTLAQLGLTPESRHVVLNFADTRAGCRSPTSRPPSAPPSTSGCPGPQAAQVSVNQGVPLLQNGRRDQVAKQLRGLVNRFTPAAASKAAAEASQPQSCEEDSRP